MRDAILFILFLSWSALSFAQNVVFSNGAALPEARSAVSSTSNEDYIFIANGFGPDVPYSSEIYRYDIEQDEWSVLTNQTIPKRFASLAIVGDQLFVFNGLLMGGVQNPNLEVIDIRTGQVVSVINNPQPASSSGVTTWEGKIYSFGGNLGRNEYSNKLFEFDPTQESWKELSEMPIRSNIKGEIIDGKLYAFGGYNGSVSGDLYVYDLEMDTWSAPIPMGKNVSGHTTAIIDEMIYLVGDYSDLNSLGVYDTRTNSFSWLSSNLESRRHCGAEGVKGKLYAIGGNTASDISTASANVQIADILTSNQEKDIVDALQIFPNPSEEEIYIKTEQNFDEIILRDVNGQEIRRRAFTDVLDIRDLRPGVYLIGLRKGSQEKTWRWIKK